jgi:hypothetical protein
VVNMRNNAKIPDETWIHQSACRRMLLCMAGRGFIPHHAPILLS